MIGFAGKADVLEFPDVGRDGIGEADLCEIDVPGPPVTICRSCVEMGRTGITEVPTAFVWRPTDRRLLLLFTLLASGPDDSSIATARYEREPAYRLPCPDKDVLVGDGGCMIVVEGPSLSLPRSCKGISKTTCSARGAKLGHTYSPPEYTGGG